MVIKNPKENLKFPVYCPYRIIAVDLPTIQFSIQSALKRLGIEGELQGGNQSKQGTYLSFAITINVKSKEHLVEIDQALRAIDGVKMIL